MTGKMPPKSFKMAVQKAISIITVAKSIFNIQSMPQTNTNHTMTLVHCSLESATKMFLFNLHQFQKCSNVTSFYWNMDKYNKWLQTVSFLRCEEKVGATSWLAHLCFRGAVSQWNIHHTIGAVLYVPVCRGEGAIVSVKAHLITGFHCSHSQTAWCLANPHNNAHTGPSLLYHYIESG